MCNSAVLPVCDLCYSPTGESTVKIKRRTRWCSKYCLSLATNSGWYEGCGISPRQMYFDKYIKRKFVCDKCDQPKMVYISSYCPSCDKILCGECARRYHKDKECKICDKSLLDIQKYLNAFNDKKLDSEKRVASGRILWNLYKTSEEYRSGKEDFVKRTDRMLELLDKIGDIHSKILMMMKGGKPTGDNHPLIKRYFHFAIIGHPTAQRIISDLWYDGIEDEEDKDHKIRSDYWTLTAADYGDPISIFRRGLTRKKQGRNIEFLRDMLIAKSHKVKDCYVEIADYWRTVGRDDLALNNYCDGIDNGCHICNVMVGCAEAEGVLGIKKNIDEGYKRVMETYNQRDRLGQLHTAISCARNWLITVNYGDPDIGTTIGMEPNKRFVKELIEEGISASDGLSALLNAKIALKETMLA